MLVFKGNCVNTYRNVVSCLVCLSHSVTLRGGVNCYPSEARKNSLY